MNKHRIAAAALLLGLTASGAEAQSPPAPAVARPLSTSPPQSTSPPNAAPQTSGGLGAKTVTPGQIEKDASAILPDAGESKPSAAPTMVRDCVKKPGDCTTPVTPADQDNDRGDNPKRP